jgi:hypothetical protein
MGLLPKIKKEELPPRKSGCTEATAEWDMALVAVRISNGYWCRIAEYEKPSQANSRAQGLRKRCENFEFVTRKTSGVYAVFARFRKEDK